VKAIISENKILSALVQAGSVRGAAKLVPCSPATIQQRLKNGDFRAKYEDLKRDLLQAASAELTAKLGNATMVLSAVMNDESNAPAVRVQAASEIIRSALRYYAIAELETRVQKLEEGTDAD